MKFKKTMALLVSVFVICTNSVAIFAQSSENVSGSQNPASLKNTVGTLGLADLDNDLFGDWRLVKGVRTTSRSYKELTKNGETIKDGLLFALGELPFVGPSMLVHDIVNRYTKQPDYESIGGFYARHYYLAKPLADRDQAVKNVPVGCERKWMTIIYDNRNMRGTDIIFIEQRYDVNNLESYYKLTKPHHMP